MRSEKSPFKGRKFATEVILRIAGYDIPAMVREGQVAAIPANDMPTQAIFIASLFGMAA